MKLLSKLRIPNSVDKVFGFLLLSLIVVSLISIPVFSEPYDSPRLMIWSVLLGLSLFIAIKTKRLSSTLTKPLMIVMGIIWVWALVGTIFSLDRANSLLGVNIRMTSSLWFYSLWVVTIYLLSTLGKSKLEVLLKAWMIISGIISLWAVLQFFGVGFYEGLDAPVRSLVPSFLGNPNFAAMYIASTIFISMWYVASKNFSNKFRIFAFLVLGLNAVSLVIFASRGAIVGVLAGLVVLTIAFLLKRNWKVALGAVVVVLVLGSASYLYLDLARDQSVVTAGSDVSAQQRWYLWDNAFQNIGKHPLTGTGLGNYFIAFRQNEASYFSNSQWFDDPHNLFLHIAVNGGIPAALAFIALLGFTVWNLYKYYKITNDDFPLYLFAGLVSWSIAASFNPVIVCNWFLLALIVAFSLQYLPMRDLKISSFVKKIGYLIAFVFIIVGLSLILSETGLWLSDIYFLRNKPQSIAINKVAIYFNPTSSAAISSLAKKQLDSKKYDQSYQTYQRLEQLHPKSAYVTEGAMAGYLELYSDTHDEKYRADVYRTIPIVLDYFPNNYPTRYNIATIYLSLDDYDNALAQIKTGIVYSNGTDYGSWLLMSNIYDKMGQPENKKKALESDYKIAPSAKLRNYLK